MTVLFQQSFIENIGLPFGFNSYRFGYTDDPLITEWNADGPDDDGGSYRIYLEFQDHGEHANFDVHFQRNFSPTIDDYYMRWYQKISSDFDTDPGQNWKSSYHNIGGELALFWWRPTGDGQGYQPAFFSVEDGIDILITEPVDTFYWKDWKNVWVCFEIYINRATDHCKLWITTPSNLSAYNETLYIDSEINFPATETSYIQWGSYWDDGDNNTWFELSRFVVADEYIGPLDTGSASPSLSPSASPSSSVSPSKSPSLSPSSSVSPSTSPSISPSVSASISPSISPSQSPSLSPSSSISPSKSPSISPSRSPSMSASESPSVSPSLSPSSSISPSVSPSTSPSAGEEYACFILSGSPNIAASGENTTAQLTSPDGKDTDDFQAGRIADDENPMDSIDLAIGKYTEIEWCIQATNYAEVDETYEFRVTC